MKNILITVLLLTTNVSFGQSGFLGSKNMIDFSVDMGGHSNYQSKLIDNYSYVKSRFVPNFNFSASYGRVVTDKIEVGAAIRFQSIRLLDATLEFPTIFGNYTHEIIHHSKLNNKSFSIRLRKYRNAIAPLGVYYEGEFSVNSLNSKDSLDLFYSGNKKIIGSNFFGNTYEIDSLRSVTSDDLLNVKAFFLRLNFGKSIPITKQVGIDISMTVPVIRYFMFNGQKSTGFRLKDYDYFDDESIGYQMNYRAAFALKKRNSIALKVGIKVFI